MALSLAEKPWRILKYMLPDVRAVWTLNVVEFSALADGAVNANTMLNATAMKNVLMRFISYLRGCC